MKSLLAAFVCLCFFSTYAQKRDSTIAKPAYEMKQYWFVMLMKGKDRDKIKDTAVIRKLQEGHMANMERLHGLGKLVVAGPFGDDGNWRGVFILDCATKEEAENLLKTDPAIIAGRFDYEIHPWWTAKGTVFK